MNEQAPQNIAEYHDQVVKPLLDRILVLEKLIKADTTVKKPASNPALDKLG
jgi:hypothetical protein